MAVGDRRWTFLLQPTGKVDVLARVERTADDTFVFDVDAGYGDELVARLNRFKIRVKVDVEALPWRVLCVVGGTDVVGPDAAPPDGVREGTAAELEAARVADGWPAMGAEIVPGETIPAETGVVRRRRRLPQGLLPRPGARRADGLARRGGAPRAAHPRRRDRAPRPATRSCTTASRSACSRASPAPTALGFVKRGVEVGTGPEPLTCGGPPGAAPLVALAQRVEVVVHAAGRPGARKDACLPTSISSVGSSPPTRVWRSSPRPAPTAASTRRSSTRACSTDPLTGEPVVALVARGTAHKVRLMRAAGRASVTFRAGWEWAGVEGPVDADRPRRRPRRLRRRRPSRSCCATCSRPPAARTTTGTSTTA